MPYITEILSSNRWIPGVANWGGKERKRVKFARTPLPALLALPLAAAITTAACQRDLPALPDAFAAPPWTLAERETRIGSVDDPDYIFNPVTHMAMGPDGLLYTTHAGEGAVRRWTADGAPAGSLGGRGEGPGEFQYPFGLGFFGDSLWVWDVVAVRVSYFDLEGGFLGSVQARRTPGGATELPVRPVVPLRDGTFMGMTPPASTSIARGSQTESPFVRLDPDGRSLNRIWTQPWRRHDTFATSSASQPFGDEHLSGMGARGLLVVGRRAWTGEGDPTIRVSEIGFDGDTIFTAAVPYDPVPLAAERFDSVVRAWAGGNAASEAEIREAMYRPSHLPAVSRLIGARDGTVWVQRFDPVEVGGGGRMIEWWVLDDEGIPLGRALTPVELDVRVIAGGTVWGIERDELGVEYIIRHRVVKDG